MLGACRSAPRAPVDDPGLGAETPRPASRTLTLADMVPWAAREGDAPTSIERKEGASEYIVMYEVTEGAHKGAVLRESRRPGPTPASWLITRHIEGEAKAQEERLQKLDESSGSLLLPSTKNFERNVAVLFDPPALTAPAILGAGETVRTEFKMRLPILDKPSKLREKGTGRSEITSVSEQRIRTGAGEFDAVLVREVFTSDFSKASAVRTIDRWYAPGVGLVAERWHEEVKAFGIPIESSSQAIRVRGAGYGVQGSGDGVRGSESKP